MDRGYLSANRNFTRRACSATAGAGAIARHWFEEIHAPSGQNSERSARAFYSQGILEEVRGIADTGFLVAFARSRDIHHEWAVSVAEQVTEPLLTCEAVLAETAFHLQDVGLVLEMIADGLIALSFDCNDHLPQLGALAKRYKDRKPDLADLCLIRMSEIYPKHSVITVDADDFRVYRRNKREIIRLISPPRG